jgi:general secretion pathway protein G
MPASQPALKHAGGFTLIELMLAVSIIGVLASLAVPNYVDFIEKARVARAVAELHGLAKELKGFALSGGQYPNSLADIGRSTMLDPWGTPYQYYKINCGTIDDIPNLAKLKLLKRDIPQVTPATYSLSNQNEWYVPFAVDDGDHRGLVRLTAGGGGAAGGGAGAAGGGVGGGAGGAGGGAGGPGGGGGPPCGGVGGARKDRFLVPINSDFDIYSMGKNRATVVALTPPQSHDDVIRASDGGFYGLAKNF